MTSVAIDVGGTFTDCVVLDEAGEITEYKAFSTPPNYVEGLMASLEKAAADRGLGVSEFLADVTRLIHGSTVATNALLTGSGAKVGMLTTKGFRDVYQIRRGIKLTSIYNLFVPPYEPLVPRYLRRGVEERTLFTGEIITPLSEEDVRREVQFLLEDGVEAIAICYLHSYANPTNERLTKYLCNEIAADLYCVSSHDVLPTWREYERFSTTVVSAYVGPEIDTYLSRLDSELRNNGFAGELLIVKNSALVQDVEGARKNAAELVDSGPAAAPISGLFFAGRSGFSEVLTLDVGGTSTDVALCTNGSVATTSEGWVGDERVALKKVDTESVGGGGGSIAWLDGLGVLRVGPKSAGAKPGPACYGRGGTEPTVSDAALLLGYLSPDAFLGGELTLRKDLAEKAIGELGAKLGMDTMATARTIMAMTNKLVADGIATKCTKKGFDPRDYVLVAGGGAGALHAAEVAATLQISRAIVPMAAPLFSAFGMMNIDIGREYARSYLAQNDSIDWSRVRQLYDEMEQEARGDVTTGDPVVGELYLERTAEMRYTGQYHEVEIELPAGELGEDSLADTLETFHQQHEKLYAFRIESQPVEFLTFRLRAGIRHTPPKLAQRAVSNNVEAAIKARRSVWFGDEEVATPVYDGERLGGGAHFSGPAIIEERLTTIVVPGEFTCTVDDVGSYLLKHRE